MFIRFSFTGLY